MSEKRCDGCRSLSITSTWYFPDDSACVWTLCEECRSFADRQDTRRTTGDRIRELRGRQFRGTVAMTDPLTSSIDPLAHERRDGETLRDTARRLLRERDEARDIARRILHNHPYPGLTNEAFLGAWYAAAEWLREEVAQ